MPKYLDKAMHFFPLYQTGIKRLSQTFKEDMVYKGTHFLKAKKSKKY